MGITAGVTKWKQKRTLCYDHQWRTNIGDHQKRRQDLFELNSSPVHSSMHSFAVRIYAENIKGM